MGTNRRQLALLGAILAVLALVLYWQTTRADMTPEQYAEAMRQRIAAPPGGTQAAPSATPRRAGAGTLQIPAVALASLDREQPEPADSGRDPFRFEGAASARPGRGGAALPGGAPAPPPATAPAAPQAPPGPPPIQLKFIGIAKQGQGRLYAVLRDDRGIYYGAEGDMVEGRYRILRVSADAVELAYADGRGRVVVPLSGGGPRP